MIEIGSVELSYEEQEANFLRHSAMVLILELAIDGNDLDNALPYYLAIAPKLALHDQNYQAYALLCFHEDVGLVENFKGQEVEGATSLPEWLSINTSEKRMITLTDYKVEEKARMERSRAMLDAMNSGDFRSTSSFIGTNTSD